MEANIPQGAPYLVHCPYYNIPVFVCIGRERRRACSRVEFGTVSKARVYITPKTINSQFVRLEGHTLKGQALGKVTQGKHSNAFCSHSVHLVWELCNGGGDDIIAKHHGTFLSSRTVQQCQQFV